MGTKYYSELRFKSKAKGTVIARRLAFVKQLRAVTRAYRIKLRDGAVVPCYESEIRRQKVV